MAKKKYAMIAINQKIEDDGTHIRRVLICYTDKSVDKRITTYKDTKFIIADPYFSNNKSSHKYIFEDDGYILDKVSSENPYALFYIFKSDIYNKRAYRSIDGSASGYDIPKAIEFEANSKKEAIKIFNERNELR